MLRSAAKSNGISNVAQNTGGRLRSGSRFSCVWKGTDNRTRVIDASAGAIETAELGLSDLGEAVSSLVVVAAELQKNLSVTDMLVSLPGR